MRFTDIKIDGFGVWHDLVLRGLSPEVTVFYGPNEAGKSTLMQFLRTVMYGVSPARRERYMPPIAGGRPGGWLKVIGDDGPLTISRYADRGPTDVGKVTVTLPDGEEQGDRLLREALEHVDETTYNNIFAVGLREVQELATLSDTAAAQWLYRLTSGLDRISLYDVIHMLHGTRARIFSSADEKSELRTLVARRDQLRGELDELVAKGRRWAQSAVKLRELADEVDRRQAEVKSIGARARRLELAINVKPLWLKRDKIDGQLDGFANLRPLEDGTLDALDELKLRIEEHERQRDILRGQRHQLRDDAARLGINDLLVRNGQRLEALLEQVDWLQAVERQAKDLAEEVKHLDARLTSENERLASEWTGAGKLPPRITSDIVEQIAPQARAIEATEQLLESAKHELEIHRAGEHEFRSQIESAMTGGDKLGLPKDLDSAGDLVAQLRRRLQIEQRLEAAVRQADDLQQQAQELVGVQVVPIGVFNWLIAVFVVGMVALAAWWLVPAATLGQYGGWLAGIGVVAAIFALMAKFIAENSASTRFDAAHRQIELILNQIDEAEDERARLDNELPLTNGSVQLRLQHAERHLAELERILPVESQRREVESEIDAAERRVKLAEEKHAAALANWKAKLRANGLPDTVTAANLAIMASQCERLAELEARIENRRYDMSRRQREFTIVSQRIVALAEETGLKREKATPLEQLDHLAAEYRKQTERVARRDELRKRAGELKAEEIKNGRAAIDFQRRLGVLFEKCGVADEHELRQLAARLAEAEELRKKRAAATREIAAAIGKHGTEQDFAPLLAPDTVGRLDHDWESLTTQLEQLDRDLKDALQRRGALVEQQRALAADRSLSIKQIELDVVDEQIKKATRAWRDRATVSLFLERIREDYEQHRQPETLKEASGYLAQLTSGRYTRIWTPLAHDILFVDQADGQPLPVNVLSRGTREQLFVSLRLALVAAYARRGIHLPMILDDVFVNFDAGRTKAACAVLRDFAKQGHQLLVFTCHEHVWRMFKDLKVDARRIPNRYGEVEEETAVEQPVPEPIAVEFTPEPVVIAPKVIEQIPAPPPPPIIIEDEIDEEVIEEYVVPELPPAPAPALAEVEYWWHEPAANGANHSSERESSAQNGWLPEPVIYPEKW